MNNRALHFLDEQLRITNVFSLFQQQKMKALFEATVLADTSTDIERHISDSIDWIISKNKKQWNNIMNYLEQNLTNEGNPSMIGKVSKEFMQERSELVSSFGLESTRVIASYDKEKEASKLSEELKKAVIHTALVEVSAVGLGLGAILTASVFDFTGLTAVGAFALGLGVMPYRKMQSKKDLTNRIEELRRKLSQTMTYHFERQMEMTLSSLKDAISPYTLFTKTEIEQIGHSKKNLDKISQEITDLAKEIDKEFPPL